ncbi:glutamine-hydrolyzing GMP synthase [Ignatzschineria rhizosphaerae]|uniref:GMP synthase [glutamine-hydrolyzing] n=1 Tax=Ignatzschineria rhizosphaerae TaxID=2923279 RepID=A0ABY3X082_9GAMM|nr:glutamine-hydrolyzing GMP synthase [Ignatzschineria rhizosphaerae]UNM96269.1 glutamine-hydrolyzing GMP synthase [Ignatzschineria rhizosphaerae]
MAQHLDNKILIVHANQQDAQKIARLLRDAEYYSEITTINDLASALDQFPPKGILSNTPTEIEAILTKVGENIPIFNLDETSESDAIINFASAQNIEPVWNVTAFIEHHTKAIQNTVQNDEVILGLSGGVDSSVVAALIHKAIGNQLTCVFVDTGLLRLNEGDKVMQTFAENMGINIIRVDSEARFLEALKGESDPEKKRKIIGELFVRIFEEESRKLPSAKWLAQGTIYPDILESLNTKDGVAVKSHHNVGGLPEDMDLKLLEPISSLFKHEVRELGVALGLPRAMVYRHPFPGPGLGVRILGEIKKEYADILRYADDIFIEELIKADLYDKTSQAFAVFVPVKSVGVQDDKRVYDYVIALRAIETVDFMTARAAHLPWEFIEHISTRIIKEVNGVSRVTYDISNKPPATIEWE